MTIFLNDQPREVAPSATVLSVLTELALEARPGLAVAINDEVSPRRGWSSRTLTQGDRLLLIQATQGG